MLSSAGAEEIAEEFRSCGSTGPLSADGAQDCAGWPIRRSAQPMQRGNRGDILRQLLGVQRLPADRGSRRSGSNSLYHVHLAGTGIERWLRRSWRICCF